ncbi:MAG: hypothetical protein KG075_02725, partial [Alphaproteobacteria bacterium]|nr:hypothetical protein [Alphaproteobacteria bacterium]
PNIEKTWMAGSSPAMTAFPNIVAPAKAGAQSFKLLDARLRGHDESTTSSSALSRGPFAVLREILGSSPRMTCWAPMTRWPEDDVLGRG